MIGEVTDKARVLVKENISSLGVDLLREHFEVDVRTDMTDQELKQEINEYDGLIIRSSTQVTADILEGSRRLKVIGRAGTGVDNIDVDAATEKGIVVANAPESNAVAAAEHAIALLTAQVRNIPQAHISLKSGKWERSKFKGEELTGKTLGVVGLGRIGMLVAQRARGLRMEVIAYDPFVSAERFREHSLEKAESPEDVYQKADFITVHLPKTPETMGFVGTEAFARMKDGVRVVNAARGGIVDEGALQEALDSGKVASAGIDVYSEEPCPPDFPLLAYDNVVATPHLGASTEEAQDRAGTIIAEQVTAALLNRFVSNAVNIPSVSDEALERLQPFLPLAETLGRLIVAIAEAQGFKVSEVSDRRSLDFTILVTVVSKDRHGELSAGGTTIGPNNRPRLVKIYRHDIDIEPAQHMVFFQYEDIPGMIGKVGTVLGEEGINIAFMNVGRRKEEGKAVMAVTLDHPVPQRVLREIVQLPGFHEARAVEL